MLNIIQLETTDFQYIIFEIFCRHLHRKTFTDVSAQSDI